MTRHITYKDVQVPAALQGLINHMDDVESYREELRNLGSQWELLTILGQMSGTGMDMSETHQGFQHLTSELLGQLGLEILNKTVRELTGKAQVTVDIVIRNLFERTADIGFLATDEDIRRFLKSSPQKISTPTDTARFPAGQSLLATADQQGTTASLTARFQEYVAKYSVYFNIILLDTGGQVLAQLDPDNDIAQSHDPLLQEVLNTSAEYVEIYRQSDMLPAEEQALIYAYRVTETNVVGSAPLGILCLCFRFEDEMQGIFKSLSKTDDWSILTLLDSSGRVLASSDQNQVPLGVTVPFNPQQDFSITRFAGREYLSKTCATKGYQGFFGLGWYGHVMLPIEHAFTQNNASGLKASADEDMLESVMHGSRLFSDTLRSIPGQADHIQDELERTVWNGNVRETDTQSKVLLWNISAAGARTKKVFEESIDNLHKTVISGLLNDVEFQAALAVDIMDRNLYERANDCRWWALTSDFRKILAQTERSEQEQQKIAEILRYINGLYTVYTNLLVFDRSGKILAVSNAKEQGLLGTVLQESWVQQTLELKTSQDYCVSPFAATALYQQQHTYIYSAAIKGPQSQGRSVGGIGIVFDSTPQFKDMLHDSLLRDQSGAIAEGCFGIFTDRHGYIISSTEERFKIGQPLSIDQGFFRCPPGSGFSSVIEFEGSYYAVGARTSSGYREYKTTDGYANDIIGLIFMPLAPMTSAHLKKPRKPATSSGTDNIRDNGEVVELATFFAGQQWLGVRAEKVCEAIYAGRIIHIPGSAKFILGKTMYQDKLVTVIDFRRQLSQGLAAKEPQERAPIVIVKTNNERIGLVVDNLGQIPAVSKKRMEPVKQFGDSKSNYLECLVKPNGKSTHQRLLLIIDPDKLINTLLEEGSCQPEPEEAF